MKTTEHPDESGRITARTLIAYVAVLAVAVVLFYLIRSVGTQIQAPAPVPNQDLFGNSASLAKFEILLHLLLALAVIIVAARCVGAVFRRFGQPPVIGEVIAGILLGPSLLASVFPEVHGFLLPTEVAPYIGIIAQIGIVLYMFLIGLELNPAHVRNNSGIVLAVSHTSIIVPFISGAALSLVLYPIFSTSDVPFPVFLLFMGTSMSVTAFPVLARILADRGLQHTRVGTIAITCAAVDDVTAWCLLAFVVGVAKNNLHEAVQTLALTIIYLLFMVFIVRRLILRITRKHEQESPKISQATIGMALVMLLLSACTTEWIGIHALFGAFLLGAIVPHDSELAATLRRSLHDLVVILFLPAYFAYTGMRTEIGLINSMEQWLFLGLIVLTASFGKFGGSFVAARFTGMQWRESAVIGVLMNTRGLMELIVLNIGFDLKVLSPTLFTMMVLVAILTTVATTPIVDLLMRKQPSDANIPPLAHPAAQARVATNGPPSDSSTSSDLVGTSR